MSDLRRGGWIICPVMAVGASLALAQARATGADLTGVVFDKTKAVLPDTTVTASHAGTGSTRTAVTDRNVRFNLRF